MLEDHNSPPSEIVEEIASGKGIAIGEVARRFTGGVVSQTTLTRWIKRGVRTPHGQVRLEAVRCGGRWMTTESALRIFLAALTQAMRPTSDTPHAPTELERHGS
jgi:hypothetical protein